MNNLEYYIYSRMRDKQFANFSLVDFEQYNRAAKVPVTLDALYDAGYMVGSIINGQQAIIKKYTVE